MCLIASALWMLTMIGSALYVAHRISGIEQRVNALANDVREKLP